MMWLPGEAEKEASPNVLPQGGHQKMCPAAYLCRWMEPLRGTKVVD